MLTIKVGRFSKQVPVMLQKIVVGIFICHAVDWIPQYQPDGGCGKLRAMLRFIFLTDDICRLQERTCLPEGAVDFQYNLFFFLHRDEKANGTLIFSTSRCHTLGRKAGRCFATQPAPIFRQLHQVILDTFRENIAFKFCDNGQHLNDDFGCADPRIDIVGADQKCHIMALEIFQQPHEIGSFPADSV